MRHLKFFEGYLDKYYFLISEYEWEQVELINFDKKLQNEIESRLKDGWETEDRSSSFMISIFPDTSDENTLFGEDATWRIGQAEDNWFYATFEAIDEDWDQVFQIYKCDQFEGLKKLLEDQNII